MRCAPLRLVAVASAVAAAVALVACSAIGPDYVRPKADLPVGFRPDDAAPAPSAAASAPTLDPVELANLPWWRGFGDPNLERLIRIALDENKDLQLAAARVAQYQAQLQTAGAAGKPQVSTNNQAERLSLSQNRIVPLAAGVDPVGNNFEVSAAVNWELDLWGRVRRVNEAARADAAASEENRRAATLSLVANVASTYVTLLAEDAGLEMRRRVVKSRAETFDLLTKKLAGGGTAELPVLKSRAELEEAQAELTVAETQVAQLENALSILLGRNPGPIERGTSLDAIAVPQIPAGLPMALLIQRPDVRASEQELVAANARIGIAKAQYLPLVDLTASYGFASADLSNLTKLSSNISSFGLNIIGPLFTWGRIEGQVAEAEAIRRQKEITYLKNVQVALQEVENALVTYRKSIQRGGVRDRQLQALRDYSQSAQKRYQGGGSSYLEVLDAERNLIAGEILASQTRQEQLAALITVYKSIGGGWNVPEQATSVAPTAAPRP